MAGTGYFGGNALGRRMEQAGLGTQPQTPAQTQAQVQAYPSAGQIPKQTTPMTPADTARYYARPQLAPIAQDIQALQRDYPKPMGLDAQNYRYFAGDAKRAGLPPAFAEEVYMSGWNPMGNQR